MPGTAPDVGAHARLDRGRRARLVEEGDVLLPGQADHHPQPGGVGEVEQPAQEAPCRSARR